MFTVQRAVTGIEEQIANVRLADRGQSDEAAANGGSVKSRRLGVRRNTWTGLCRKSEARSVFERTE